MKSISKVLSTLLVVSAGMFSLPQGANAVTLGNGAIAFAQPPRLVSATTPDNGTNEWNATYYFTVQVPATATEALQKVTFTQRFGSEDIEFDEQDTFAFEGTRDRQGTKLAIQSVNSKDKQQTLTVTFDAPVPPGKTVTIALRPYRNPFYDGVYLFDVAAFPSGQQTIGQSLGLGRLQFYTNTSTEG